MIDYLSITRMFIRLLWNFGKSLYTPAIVSGIVPMFPHYGGHVHWRLNEIVHLIVRDSGLIVRIFSVPLGGGGEKDNKRIIPRRGLNHTLRCFRALQKT